MSNHTDLQADPDAGLPSARPGSFEDRWLGLTRGLNIPLNLADEFESIAGQRPDAPAITLTTHDPRQGHRYDSITFGRCRELADLYARGLRSHGVAAGDNVLVLMKPMLDLVPVFVAMWKIGAIPLALDPGAAREQKLKSIEQIAPKVLIGIPAAHLLRLLYPKTFRSISVAVVAGRRGVLRAPTLESFVRHPSPAVPSCRTLANDVLAVAFTSGSTGPAKGVVYTHGTAASVIQNMKDSLGVTAEDVCLACHPAFAMYFVGMGASVIIPDLDPRVPAGANIECLLDIIGTCKPSLAFMQLPILRNLCRYCAEHGLQIPHLRKILTTGASVSPELIESAHAVMQPDGDVWVMYGATEALAVCFTAGRDILALGAAGTRQGKGTYLGRPTPFVAVRIVPITAAPIPRWDPALSLPPGAIGEICVHGAVVTPAYQNRPEATRHAKIPSDHGLWHRMGDAGYLDENGGLWLCGRISDGVPTGGRILYPDLVEPIFNAHPAVKRSAIIGLPRAHSALRRPVILVECADAKAPAAERARLCEELKTLAGQHPHAAAIEEVIAFDGAFPMDVRHNAKIRRDLLTEQMAGQRQAEPETEAACLRPVQFRGYRVACFEKGEGQPLLFLHNAGNDHHIWDYQIEYFSRKCRTVAVDSLGYGASDRPPIDYTLPLYTEMVAAIVDSLALAPVTIVATCTGASMALNYAWQHPRKVGRLVLFHIATKNTAQGGKIGPHCRLLPGRPRLVRALTAATDALLRRGLLQDAMVRGQYGVAVERNPAFVEYLRALYSRKGQVGPLFNLFSNWESFAGLDQMVSSPELPPLNVFWGEANKVLRVERGRELCRTLCPGALETIPDAGHLAMREKRDLINRRIDELVFASTTRAAVE